MLILCTPRIESVLLALTLCAGSIALQAQSVYESVDAQGHSVFSDRPQGPGAERKLVSDAASPPKMAHFCWTNCFTLIESHGIYSRVDGTDETWTVERFTPTSVALRRHDAPAEWNGFKREVRYTGRVVGEELVEVTVDGLPTSDIRMAWGSALDTLPGSNVERDRLQAQGLWPPAEASGVEGPPPGGDAQSLTTASEAPPPLAPEEQPPCEVEGTLWTPGFWAWRASVYHWVPGAWVHPPRPGLLWTPGYWVLTGGVFVFRPGFWGPFVGDYGGINYRHGYFGAGYTGGRWVGDRFHYNTAVSNVDTSVIRNVYHAPGPAGNSVARVSYVGAASGAATRLEHHNRKSRNSTVPQVAQNSAASHSRATSEAAATSKPTLSARARASH